MTCWNELTLALNSWKTLWLHGDAWFMENGDETWVYSYDFETVTQWKTPQSPWSSMANMKRCEVWQFFMLMTVLFVSGHNSSWVYAPDRQIINKNYYLTVLFVTFKSRSTQKTTTWDLENASWQYSCSCI